MHIARDLFTRLPMRPPQQAIAEQQQEHCTAASKE
jgi:hypothetical protein